MKEKRKSMRVKILSYVLILSGVYFVFFPNRYTPLSLFDFFKGEEVSTEEEINLDSFSRIPVLRGGRVKPIDSVARNTGIREKESKLIFSSVETFSLLKKSNRDRGVYRLGKNTK